ncbi:MAG: hypothetical protein KAR80_06205 [Rhodospirillaceae bacterium]|nr:hypothetical protein [Rhodospirillaceae bacterium]
MQSFIDILVAFGFRELQEWIVAICSFMFMLSLLGGMISALFVINSKLLKPPKLTTRISFRMFILSEIILIFAAGYYHTFMVGHISGAHVVYWIAAVMMMPLLSVIGAQVMYIIFSGKMKAKKKAARDKARKIRNTRTTTMEDGHSKIAKTRPKKK